MPLKCVYRQFKKASINLNTLMLKLFHVLLFPFVPIVSLWQTSVISMNIRYWKWVLDWNIRQLLSNSKWNVCNQSWNKWKCKIERKKSCTSFETIVYSKWLRTQPVCNDKKRIKSGHSIEKHETRRVKRKKHKIIRFV